MTSLIDLLQQGTAHAWLFVTSAILLGALHGLEPGHSKTMMAAFIIVVQGTVAQAVLLGLAATLSHTAVVWVIALAGQHLGREWGGEAAEPYFQLASAVVIAGIALWMAWRIRREQHHEHGHRHRDAAQQVATGAGLLTLEVFEDGVPPRWRLRAENGPLPAPGAITVETVRPNGTRQAFGFVARGGFLESRDAVPEPHAFTARLRLDGLAGAEIHEVAFEEHDHMNLGDADDAHARAHAEDIRRRFQGRTVTTGQIALFGLTGGLIPCPAAITVLLLCIQLKQFSLGFALVACFGIGLALTMVSAGVLAALGVRHAASRWPGFGGFARQAPYASAALIVLVGLYTGWLGWQGLHHEATTHAAWLYRPVGFP
ncbi:nickel/cobalt efflux transporter RcnA [Methylorubrum populi]|uniref:nickel/cobalt efflux transporter n=1 Tax=Methylorubrum rhodesianum TaxID=29427 RepID=UPI00190B5B5B|nr:nickel/cobalt efflux transporter [Methylorubrum rhodesianum]MBK3401633.1 nickel/cobalt efflux transporter RcnA [Methylorubrum rhodesianum]MBY0143532.1 nickel/cobalt efflux transporter RcnA [Methylorubrum populi]